MEIEDIKKWIDKNLLTKQEAMEITAQSLTAFNQSVNTGKLTPFFDHGSDRSRTRLYLKKDVELYAKQVKEWRNKRK